MAAFVAIDALLFLFAARRPWAGLVVLLLGLPFNGFLTRVVGDHIAPTELARIALAGWHDALLLGIALAAFVLLVRGGWRQLGPVEWLVAAVLALGLVYVAVSPFRLTALYVYRVLYEPPLLLAAILVIARAQGVPEWLGRRTSLAVVGAGVAAAVFAWLQVYGLGFRYLNVYYKEAGEQLHHSFVASGIDQPRAIGTFSSPNEFGAYLAIVLALLVAPRLLPLSARLRSVLVVAVAMTLLLTFSRSGWLAAGVAIVVVVWLSRRDLPSRAELRAGLTRWATIRSAIAPTAVLVILALFVSVNAGVPEYVRRTAQGAEPSAAGRVESARQGVSVLIEHPLGLGLGTAGPKAVRLDETAGQPRILTEMWYLLYAIQTGIGGLALLLALAGVILVGLWRSRAGPWARVAIAIGLGLGAGALFIPIIEDPAVFTPLWAIAGLGLAHGLAAPQPSPARPVSGGLPSSGPGSPGAAR